MIRRTPLRRSQKPLKRTAIKKPTLEEVQAKYKLVKGSEVPEPQRQKRIRPRAKKKHGQKSQIEVFREVWEMLPHISEVSGEPLFELPDDPSAVEIKHWLSQFSHLLNKGTYKKFKHRIDNIRLKTPAEHDLWEKFKERVVDHCDPDHRIGWQRIVDAFIILRNEANGIPNGY